MNIYTGVYKLKCMHTYMKAYLSLPYTHAHTARYANKHACRYKYLSGNPRIICYFTVTFGIMHIPATVSSHSRHFHAFMAKNRLFSRPASMGSQDPSFASVDEGDEEGRLRSHFLDDITEVSENVFNRK